MKPWLVIHTKPACEVKARDVLRRDLGLDPYLPLEAVTVSHAGRMCERTRPFFPRYMFVQEGDYDPVSVRYMPGVSDFVRRGSLDFARLDEKVIQAIRDRQWADGLLHFGRSSAPVRFRRGHKVGVNLTGSVDGYDLVGTFQRMRGPDRAIVLLSILGSTRESVVGLHQIERIAA